MRFRGVAIACLTLAAHSATPTVTLAQSDEPSEQLRISADAATTWDQAGETVVALQGPVTIQLDQATLSARQAVVWLSRGDGPAGRQRAQIALVGDAKVAQRDATRSGDRLFVTAQVSGRIRFTAEARVEDDRSDTELYGIADAMRRANDAGEPAPVPEEPPARVPEPAPREAQPVQPGREPAAPPPPPPVVAPAPVTPPPRAATQPASAPTTIAPGEPVTFRAGTIESVETDDGTLAVALTDGVTMFQSGAQGVLELQADSAVVFTNIRDPKQDIQRLTASGELGKAITAAYLEGDVRIVLTPTDQTQMGEQRLEAKRAYYEFGTDRAIMTEAVVHTVQPQLGLPVVMRAKIVRQLAQGEYRANDAQLSTSRFANPSYSINAQRMYVRREYTGDPRLGSRTKFSVAQPTFRFFNTPVFYLPYATGSMTDRGSVLRGIGFENSTAFGTGVETEWGLFETLGKVRPQELDATYRLDYYSDRGPAVGLDAEYGGGVISDALKEQFNFEGEFTAYGVYDEGFDDFGRGRVGEQEVTNDQGDADWRGRLLYEHQHFFFDDYQVQFRAGYVSDATFLEQWFDRDFDEGPPTDVMLYVKRQRDTEAYTFLTQIQPSNVVTTSDMLQEQFEVERLPELGYRRVGDSFGNDNFTFFSRNTVGGYSFNTTRATLAEQGFGPGRLPGIPSLGYTGVEQDYNVRGDFRQEVAMPLNAGRFKVVPYGVARLTSYGDSPEDGNVNRAYGALGARVSTAFWRQYDHVESRLLDVHRLRHVIEPELHAYASAATEDRNDVFVYEEDVDGILDVSAVQVALRQRWQTKRGGPGRWRSVDFLTLNVEGNFFANQPDEEEIEPRGFRGLFFASMPEASLPRNGVNADATWRISDNTVALVDAQQNLDEGKLATAGAGLLVRRDERLTYFLGNRYIDELESNITSIALSYELSPKYTITFSQNYDFGLGENVSTGMALLRQFDAFFAQVSVGHDNTTDQSTFNFNIYPKGLGYGVNAEQLGGVFRNER